MTRPWLAWEFCAEVLGDWAEAFRLSLGADRLTCWARAAQDELRAVFWAGGEAPPLDKVSVSGHPLAWVVRERVGLRAERQEIFRGLQGGWAVAVPVPDPEGEILGALSLELRQAPAPDCVRVAELAAAAAGRLLATAAAQRHAADDLRKDQVLHHALEAIERELDLETLAASACEQAQAASDAQGALLALWDAASDSGTIAAVSGSAPSELKGAGFGGETSHLGLSLRAVTVLPREHAGAWGDLAPFAPGFSVRVGSFIIAPMLDGDTAIGALAVLYRAPRAFREGDIRRLEILARFVGPAVRNATRYARLSAEAKVDPLTGLANRRGLEERLGSEMAAAQQGAIRLSAILLDLDHFKEVNDRWGHEAGDAALRSVAQIVQRSIRPGDAAGRWGGEEILVLLPGIGLQAAAYVAERIRQSVENSPVIWGSDALALRVSAGVSCFPDAVSKPGDLLASADSALYFAKEAGRNAVAVAGGAGGKGGKGGFRLHKAAT